LYQHRKVILIAIGCLAALFFIESLLHDLYPERIRLGAGKLSLTGLYILASIYGVLYFTFRKVVKDDPELGFIPLSILGILIVFFSELVFQVYRQAGFPEDYPISDRMDNFFRAVIGSPAFSIIISVPMAAKFKHLNKVLTYILTVGLALLMWFIAVKLGYIEFNGFEF
jgi:hypothetical protein